MSIHFTVRCLLTAAFVLVVLRHVVEACTSSTTSTTSSSTTYYQCYTYSTDSVSVGKCSTSCSTTNSAAVVLTTATDSNCSNYASSHPASWMQCATGGSPAFYCRPTEVTNCATGETKGSTTYTSLTDCYGCNTVASVSSSLTSVQLPAFTSETKVIFVWNATTSTNNVVVYLGQSSTDVASFVTGTYSSSASTWNNGVLYASIPAGSSYYMNYKGSTTGLTALKICFYYASATLPACPTTSGTAIGSWIACKYTLTKPTTQVIVTPVGSASGTVYYSINTFNLDTTSSMAYTTAVTIATSSFSTGTNTVYFYYHSTTSGSTIYYSFVVS